MNLGTDTRERIVQSARELFYAKSYADVGVAAICARAGVKKGSFYHFFPSKRHLTVAVMEEAWVGIKTELLDHAFAPDLPPLERLRRFTGMAYDYQRRLAEQTGQVYGCPFGNIAAEQATQDEQLRGKANEIFSRLRSGLRDTLAVAVQRGDLSSIDLNATAEAMFAYFEGVMLMAKTANDPQVMARLLPAMIEIRIPTATA